MYGAHTSSNAGLLAIIIKNGTKGRKLSYPSTKRYFHLTKIDVARKDNLTFLQDLSIKNL